MDVRSRQRVSGFTLIEILVVLVVVGMLVALATFTLGGNSLRRDLDNEVEKLYLLMETVSDQAVLNNTELGLILEDDHYRFLAFEEQSGSWKPSQNRLFRQRAIPDWLVITNFTESDAPLLGSDDDAERPAVVLFSSGETTPFELELSLDKDTVASEDYVHRLVSDGISPIDWQHPGRADDDDED